MRLTNTRTGEYREVDPKTAFLGALIFGPFYFMYKGLWGHGLILLVIGSALIVAAVATGGSVIVGFIPSVVAALFAYRWVTDFYEQRGFAD